MSSYEQPQNYIKLKRTFDETFLLTLNAIQVQIQKLSNIFTIISYRLGMHEFPTTTGYILGFRMGMASSEN